MSNQQQFEDNIKKVLFNKAETIKPRDDMFDKIESTIKLNNKNMVNGKLSYITFNFKKSIIAAACGFTIVGLFFVTSSNFTASALQSINKYVNGYIDMKHYDNAPSKADLQKDLGYTVKLPDSLPGGYKIIDASIDGHIDGSTPDKQQYDKRGVGAIYSIDKTKQNGITLSVQKTDVDANSPIFKNAKPVNIGNTTAYWTEYTIHVQPVGTKLSKEEQQKEDENIKNGKEILITIGNKPGNKNMLKDEFKTVYSLKWKDNGINYVLTDQNNKLNLAQMTQLAEHIINTK